MLAILAMLLQEFSLIKIAFFRVYVSEEKQDCNHWGLRYAIFSMLASLCDPHYWVLQDLHYYFSNKIDRDMFLRTYVCKMKSVI